MHRFSSIRAASIWHGFLLLAGSLLLGLAAAPALAAETSLDLARSSCIIEVRQPIALAEALARAADGACTGAQSTGAQRDSWLVQSGISIRPDPGMPLSVHLKQTLFERLTVHVRYADGTLWSARHDPGSANGHAELGGMVRIRVPWRDSAVDTIALHAENAIDQRGTFVRPALENMLTESADTEQHALLYGLFGGVIFATLFINLVLMVWLRYAFLFFYCGMTAATFVYGLAASGLLTRMLPPGLPLNFGSVIAEAILPVMLWFAVAFTMTLLERGTVHLRIAMIGITLATLQVGVGVAAVFALFLAPGLLSIPLTALNLIGAVAIALIFPLALIAYRRGSRIVLIYMIAWTAPVAGAFARIFAGLGVIETTPFIENSYFYAMSLECVLSMVGIAYRISNLRAERDEARAREIELTYLAETDALTGLLNRRAFMEYMIRRTGKNRAISCLLLIDIDHFKTINDGFGHDFGDRVLREAGRLLENIAPPGAIVGRLGGEEFALVVPQDRRDDAAAMILRAFRATPMTDGIRITVSIGSAVGVIGDDRSWRHVYRRADSAMYEAKRRGRDQHVPAADSAPPSSVASAA